MEYKLIKNFTPGSIYFRTGSKSLSDFSLSNNKKMICSLKTLINTGIRCKMLSEVINYLKKAQILFATKFISFSSDIGKLNFLPRKFLVFVYYEKF